MDDLRDWVAHIGDLRTFANRLIEANLAVCREYERCQSKGADVSEEYLDRFHYAITDLRDLMFEYGFGRQ